MGSLYYVTVPVFKRGLGNMRYWLEKSETYADTAQISMNELLEAKLAPDMFNLIQQVGYAYFTSLEATENLFGGAPPEMGYDEKTVGDLYESLDRVIGHLEAIDPGDGEKVGSKDVETFLLPGKKISVEEYVNYFALPNFYFHLVTAYDILRHKGVPLGKAIYIGGAAADH